MSAVADLEAALAAAPDDPLVYAAYADALTDAGDPRGDFLRLQAQVESGAVDAKAGDAELRRQWRAAAGRGWGTTPGGRIGFYPLDGLCPLARLKAVAPDTADGLAASPGYWLVRGVWVEGVARNRSWRDALPRLFDRLARSRVRMLRGLPGGDEALAALVDSPFFARLTELYLQGSELSDVTAERLAAHPHTRRLAVLDLDRNHFSEHGLATLTAAGVAVSDRQFFAPGGWDYDPPAFPTG